MNFFDTWSGGLLVLLCGVMIGIPIGMLLMMERRVWRKERRE